MIMAELKTKENTASVKLLIDSLEDKSRKKTAC